MIPRPIDVALALSLYECNVDAKIRAEEILECFDGEFMDLDDLVRIIMKPHAVIELNPSAAEFYVKNAMRGYLDEAIRRNTNNGI